MFSMSKNKITSSQGLHSGPSKFKVSIGRVGQFSNRYLKGGPRWWGLEYADIPLAADVVIYAYGSQPSFDELDNRGTPVIVVDEGHSPSISADLLSLLQRPEVRLCFRHYGFRDAQAYFRRDNYYTDVFRQASDLAAPPDHFPIHDDDPLGNAIRKVRVSLPVCASLSTRDASCPFHTREIDVLFVEEPNNPQVEVLRSMWGDLIPTLPTGTAFRSDGPNRSHVGFYRPHKQWVSEFSGYEELLSLFADTIVFVSSGLPSPLDLCAVLSGCIVIKPECSNVYSAQDIYDSTKGCVNYCDVTLTELPAILSCIFDNLDSYEERIKENLTLFDVDAEEGLWASEFRSACVSVAEGSYRLGDVISALPLGK